jgi:hypothetical protein
VPAARDKGSPEQADLLCARAKTTPRETWRGDRDTTASHPARSLEDAAEQERDAADQAVEMQQAADLDARQAAEVARAYRERRLARVAEARAALEREPRDFEALLVVTQGLFADEDAILDRVAGAKAREAWRANQFEGRTMILALAAAMADRDWEESIRF